MKKSLWISVVIILAGLAALPAACGKINEEKESIEVTETVLFGDVKEAEGIRLEIGTHWDNRLLWTTWYQPGKTADAETEFSFSADGVFWKEQPTVDAGFHFSSEYSVGMAYDGNTGKRITGQGVNIASLPMDKMLQEVADRTAPGEQRTEIVAAADHYDYYPITFKVVNEEKRLVLNDFSTDWLMELFALRVPEEALYEVTVEKNADGAVVALRQKVHSGGYYPQDVFAFGSEGCFYTFSCRRYENYGEIYDGQACCIYYLPYVGDSRTYSRDSYTIDTERMERVCELPEGLAPVELVLDEEEKNLYLAAKDERQYYLLAYETEEGGRLSLRQQLPVREMKISDAGETAYTYFVQMCVQEDGILMTWDENSFVFLAETAGEYRVWCSGVFPAAEESREEKRAYYSPLVEESAFPRENSFAFDGEKLALAAFDKWSDLSTRLLVYREGELVYSGFYEYSGELDKRFGTVARELIQAQGASNGRSRLSGMVLNPLRVTIP